MANLTAMDNPTTRRLLLMLPLLFLLGCGQAITAATNILPGGDLEEGEQLFSLSCAKCHDQDAQGDGPEHSIHLTPPANLTLVRDAPDMAYSIVFKGVPGTSMPAHPYVPRGAFEKVSTFIKSRPMDTNQEWGYPWTLPDPGQVDPASGRNLYVTACLGCHGPAGAGRGEWGADPRVWPKPANFHARNAVPGRLYYIIANGRAGTMMAPQKEKFPPAAIWSLAVYVHSLFDQNASAVIEVSGEKLAVENPYEKDNDDIVESGHDTYQLYCVACHGAQAKGSFLAPRLIDRDWMYGAGTDTNLFTVIEKGIPGKLMPGHHKLDGDRRWGVITYLRHRGGLPHPLAAAD